MIKKLLPVIRNRRSLRNKIKRQGNTGAFERGNALMLLVIALPAFIGVCGLTLDYSRGVWTRTTLQKAADAGALVGATRLPDTHNAYSDAKDIIMGNFDTPDVMTLTPFSDRYKVELSESVPTYFMGLFGHSTMEVSVSAVAITKRPIGGLREGGFPFAIINPEYNNSPDDDLVPENYGRRFIIMYGEDNKLVPDWVYGNGTVPGEVDGNSRGWRGALKLNLDGSMDGTAGADDLVYNMVNGWAGSAELGDVLLTQTGNIDNPVNKARNTLLGDESNVTWEEFDPRIHHDSCRVVMVPIVHLVHITRHDAYTTNDYFNGAAYEHDFVVVDGFAPFFILSVAEQGDVDGDGTTNDRDWITGYYIPGVQTNNFLPGAPGGTTNYGLFAPPRLVE